MIDFFKFFDHNSPGRAQSYKFESSIVRSPTEARFENPSNTTMNKAWIVLILLCAGCGGKLSDEQRKKLHEGMATQDIRRVSEAEMEISATALAQSIMADVEKVDNSLTQKSRIDSLAKARQVDIYSLMPDNA